MSISFRITVKVQVDKPNDSTGGQTDVHTPVCTLSTRKKHAHTCIDIVSEIAVL